MYEKVQQFWSYKWKVYGLLVTHLKQMFGSHLLFNISRSDLEPSLIFIVCVCINCTGKIPIVEACSQRYSEVTSGQTVKTIICYLKVDSMDTVLFIPLYFTQT